MSEYLVILPECHSCGAAEARYVIDDGEYATGGYNRPWHECTSGPSIEGGGSCCAPRSHFVIELRDDEGGG